MTDMISPDLVRLDADLGADKEAVIRALAGIVQAAGRTNQLEQVVADALAREATSPTGLPGGIAIPHCRTEGVAEPTLAFARLSPTVEFGAKDGPADLAFLILAPAGGGATHLKVLTQLARALVKTEFTDGLRRARTPDEVVALVDSVVVLDDEASTPAPAAAPSATPTPAASPRTRSLVAVTACPTGIAHTYMAAEALERAAADAGVEIRVETQGSAGATPLDPADIAKADAVIFACDVGVRDRVRFAGKPMVSAGVKRAVDEPAAMIADALRFADDPMAPRVEGTAADTATGGAPEGWGARVRRVLMTGVSYMIPFVAAGGLLIALGFLLGGYNITDAAATILTENGLFDLPSISANGLDHVLFNSPLMAYLGAVLFTLGSTAFKLFVPALAGYIAFAIADRPGIAPGFIMGALAVDLSQLGTPQSGFLGGIVGGVIAGLIAHWVGGWKVPTWARGLMPVLVIPLVTTLIAGALMLVVINPPLARFMTWLNNGLEDMSGSYTILLGVILGLMMAFDMGGPLNKVAYAFATAGIGGAAALAPNAPQLKIMAAVMLAGMTPPLALALATFLRPRLFDMAERENGKAAVALGLSFITEGAIPFAAADPLRVIPGIMLGSAVTGGLSMALDVTLRAPHGGIFVLFAVGNIIGFFVALVAGTIVGAVAVIALKSIGGPDPEMDTV